MESREAGLDKPETLVRAFPEPAPVANIEGFIDMDNPALASLLEKYGLAMDLDDLRFMQGYFKNDEGRDPTVTELKLVDTYWSDHCRHTTFGTHIDAADIADPEVKAAYNAYLAARREVYGSAPGPGPRR